MGRRKWPKGQPSGLAWEGRTPEPHPPPDLLVYDARWRTTCKECGGTVYAGSKIIRRNDGPGYAHAEHFGVR